MNTAPFLMIEAPSICRSLPIMALFRRLLCLVFLTAMLLCGHSQARGQTQVINRVIAGCRLSEHLKINGSSISTVGGNYHFTIFDNYPNPPKHLQKIPGGTLLYSISLGAGTTESCETTQPAMNWAVNGKDRKNDVSVDITVVAPSSLVVDVKKGFAVAKVAWKVKITADKDMEVDLDRIFVDEGLGKVSLKAGAASVVAISRTVAIELEKP